MSENSSSDSESLKTSSSSKSPVYEKDTEINDLLTRRAPRFAPQAPKCAKCLKSVYAAEEVRAAQKTFHKLCFKCTSCNKLLETNILTEHQGDLYCRSCYAKNYGPKGYGFGLGGTLSSETGPSSFNTTQQQQKQHQQNSIDNNRNQNAPSLRSTFSTYSNNG
jgi:cysteine/glycine-rich protein